jgi:hypothetical protein
MEHSCLLCTVAPAGHNSGDPYTVHDLCVVGAAKDREHVDMNLPSTWQVGGNHYIVVLNCPLLTFHVSDDAHYEILTPN